MRDLEGKKIRRIFELAEFKSELEIDEFKMTDRIWRFGISKFNVLYGTNLRFSDFMVVKFESELIGINQLHLL